MTMISSDELGNKTAKQKPVPEPDPELDDNELDDDELDSDDDLEPSKPNPGLPPLYAHGDPDPRPVKSWLIKHLIPACGHGLLAASGAPAKHSSCSNWRPRWGVVSPFSATS